MQTSEKIKLLERYSKALGEVFFSVSIKGKQITVKLGKKYNVCRCPDKESAEILCETLTSVARTQQGKIDEALSLLGQKCEQLELSLFSKDVHDEAQGDGFGTERPVCDSTDKASGGPAKPA